MNGAERVPRECDSGILDVLFIRMASELAAYKAKSDFSLPWHIREAEWLPACLRGWFMRSNKAM